MAGASKEESKGEAEASTEEAPRGGSKEVSTSSKEDTSAADPTEAEKNAIAAGVKNLEEHGQIDDPVEPPARNARKFAALHQQDLYADPTITILPSNTKSILSRLYDPDRKQKPELWEHIKLVAPGPADQPPAGHIKWRTKDAVAAYCLKCRVQFTYSKGTSKTITYVESSCSGRCVVPTVLNMLSCSVPLAVTCGPIMVSSRTLQTRCLVKLGNGQVRHPKHLRSKRENPK